MSVKFKIHSTPKRALAIIGLGIVIAFIFIIDKKINTQRSIVSVENIYNADYIAPIVVLDVEDLAHESKWSAALAEILSAQTEVRVPNGRIDVLSDIYAIEVDRLDKWHEGIGQAVHYANETGKIACVALIIRSDQWPLKESDLEKLKTIERTTLSNGVKILILRSENK
jgi:hypothetical protein